MANSVIEKNTTEIEELEADLQFSIVELEDVTAIPETAASSGSSSCGCSTCGSSSCSTCT